MTQFQTNKTYSLRGILDADLDPNLCKLMLHEIKSPLLEHSFQITTDDQRNLHTLNDFSKNTENYYHMPEGSPKKWGNEIYERDYGNRKMFNSRNRANEYNQAHSQYYYVPKIQKKDYSPPQQYEPKLIQYKPQDSKKEELQFLSPLQDLQKQANTFKLGTICGQIFTLDKAQTEFLVPHNRKLPRKKIFANRNNKYTRITFKQAIQKLNNIEEIQLSNFITFLSRILPVFNRMIPFRNNLRQNKALLSKMLLRYQPVDYQARDIIMHEKRIVNRVGENKMSEVFDALLRGSVKWEENYRYSNNSVLKEEGSLIEEQWKIKKQQGIDKVERDLESMLKMLSEIQEKIQDYVSREKSVEQLEIVYALLYSDVRSGGAGRGDEKVSELKMSQVKATEDAELLEKYLNNTKNQYQGSLSKSPLLSRLYRLLYSLHIDEVFYQHLSELSYIWPQICQEKYYTQNPQNFIKHICKNDVLLQKPCSSDNRLKKLDVKFEKMGFVRNVQQ